MYIFYVFDITNYIEITQSIMPKPVYLLTVQEAHKEYNSLMDQIWANYEPLDSDEFGAVGTPAFKAEACELANVLAHVSQLSSSIEDAFWIKIHTLGSSLVRIWRMQLCSHRYVRITRLLSASLVLRIEDWLCILPAFTLVVDKSKKLNKAASSD